MEYVTSKDGTRIAYEKQGIGPALILVGGGLCDRHTASCGTPLAKQLAANFTTYSYDRRGRGDSGDTQPYAVEREIEDIAALITEAGGSAHLYGMSSGAILALKSVASGLRVTKLVIFEPPFSINPKDGEDWKIYTNQVTEYVQAGHFGDAAKLFLATAGVPKLFMRLLSISPLWRKIKKLARTLPYDAQIVYDRALPTGAFAITTPTAIIDGGSSPQSMLAATEALAKRLPHAWHQTLPHQTHNVKPKVIAPIITEFLKSTTN